MDQPIKIKTKFTISHKIAAYAAAALAFAIGSSAAFAQGGSSGAGGGGGAVILPDDTVVLADPFVQPQAVSAQIFQFQLPKELVEETRRAAELMSFYSGALDKVYESTFMQKYILSASYYAVKSANDIPRNCRYLQPLAQNAPAGSKVEIVACTDRNKTYIVEELFKKMTIREQAKLLIHEGYRRHDGIQVDERNDVIIADITNGVDAALAVKNAEMVNGSVVLTAAQIASISKMQNWIVSFDIYNQQLLGLDPVVGKILAEIAKVKFTGIGERTGSKSLDLWLLERQLKNTFQEKLQVHQYRICSNGGGLVHYSASVDASAYLGLKQVIGPGSVMGAGSIFVRSESRICAKVPCYFGKNAWVNGLEFADRAQVPNSKLVQKHVGSWDVFAMSIDVGDRAQIIDSKVLGIDELVLDAGSAIHKTNIYYAIKRMDQATAQRLSLQSSKLDSIQSLVLGQSPVTKKVVNTAFAILTLGLGDSGKTKVHSMLLDQVQLDGSAPSPCASGNFWFLHKKGKHALVSGNSALQAICQ